MPQDQTLCNITLLGYYLVILLTTVSLFKLNQLDTEKEPNELSDRFLIMYILSLIPILNVGVLLIVNYDIYKFIKGRTHGENSRRTN